MDIVQIAAGSDTACALTNTGHMYCWGDSGLGIAGHPELGGWFCSARHAPNHRCLRGIALSTVHGCGNTFDDKVLCWGVNSSGALGDPNAPGGPFPNFAYDLSDVIQVSAGGGASAALLRDGDVRLWGFHTELNIQPQVPTALYSSSLHEIVALPIRGMPHCAVRADGRVLCWGGSAEPQMMYSLHPPEEIRGLMNVVEVSGDYSNSCARVAEGQLWCWGAAPLGDGTAADSTMAPVAVIGVGNATGVSVAWDHACAVLADGGVVCWGGNQSGQCGAPDSADVLTPVRVEGLPPTSQVAAGYAFSCALTFGGDVYCWGANNACQIGAGIGTSSNHVPNKITFQDALR